jgi:hypothetical protein
MGSRFSNHRKLMGEKWLVSPELPWANEGTTCCFFPTTDHSGGNYKRGQEVVIHSNPPAVHSK